MQPYPLDIGVTLDNFQSEMTLCVSIETLYNIVKIGAILSALKNNNLLSNPRTWPKDVPQQDSIDVGWETERGVKHQLEGKDIKQLNNFVYLGGNISENGRVDVEVRRRIQAGANAWRNVEGVIAESKISRKLKEKALDSCVVPASTNGLETLVLYELQQHKLQVCEVITTG